MPRHDGAFFGLLFAVGSEKPFSSGERRTQGVQSRAMNTIKRQIRSLLPPLATVVAVTLLSLWLYRLEGGKSLPALWLANGICLAVLMHRGRHGAVALVIGASCTIGFTNMAMGLSAGESIVGALGNALEMSIGLSALS